MAEGAAHDSRQEENIQELIEKDRKLMLDLKECERKCCQTTEMTLLHKYNEIKDAAQVLLGAIANMDGVTVKELHERFQLPIGD